MRKLATLESIFDHQQLHFNSILLARSLLVHIPDSYAFDLDLVKQACAYWVRRHPFLSAEIYRPDENSIQGKHFVRMNEEKLLSFDNVLWLNSIDQTEWLNVLTREINYKFGSDGPLWRLNVVKVVNPSTDFNYAFCFTLQHSICDGRNAFEVCKELLNILGALLQHKTCQEMEQVQHSPHTLEEYIHKLNLELPDDFHPGTRNPTTDKQKRISSFFQDETNGDTCSKFQHFYLDQEKSKRLNTTIKQNSKHAKLTSVLTTIVCLAFKHLYAKYQVTDVPLNKYQFALMGSLRDKIGVSNAQMGMYITNYSREMYDDQEHGGLLSEENVWQKAEVESISLQEMRKSDDDLTESLFMEKVMQMPVTNASQVGYTDENCNFKMSKIGLMTNTNCEEVIQIRQHYVRTANIYGRSGSNLMIGITTVNGNLCWAFNYNERMITTKIVGELIEEIKKIIENVCNF